MIIAFIGNVGTGKTTIAKEMEKKMRAIGIDAKYKEEFEHFLLEYAHKLYSPYKQKNYNPFSGTIHDTTKEKETTVRGEKDMAKKERNKIFLKFWSFLRPRVWPILVWIDCLLEYFFYKVTRRNKVILLDRYAYDHFISWEMSGWSNGLLRLLYMHFPKPDLAFVLDASPLTCLDRLHLRPEEQLKEDKEEKLLSLKYQRNSYLKLVDKLNLRLVNTEKHSLDSTLNEVFCIVSKHQRFSIYDFQKQKESSNHSLKKN